MGLAVSDFLLYRPKTLLLYIIGYIFLDESKNLHSTSLNNLQLSSTDENANPSNQEVFITHKERFLKTFQKFEQDFTRSNNSQGNRCLSELNLSNGLSNLSNSNNKISKSASSGSIHHFNTLNNNLLPSNAPPSGNNQYYYSTLPTRLENAPIKTDRQQDLAVKRAQKLKEMRNKFFGLEDEEINGNKTVEVVEENVKEDNQKNAFGNTGIYFNFNVASLNYNIIHSFKKF